MRRSAFVIFTITTVFVSIVLIAGIIVFVTRKPKIVKINPSWNP
tara:strand:- start:659 stop:790 length:132 start_codon:yes stop_codon:yes gene_type:complete